MQKRQKEAIEAYRRAQGFLQSHPLPGPAGYGEAEQTLATVVGRLDALSTGQFEGGRRGRNETARQKLLKRVLREQYLFPISRVARAALQGVKGIDVALRTPAHRLSARQLVADAKAVRNAVAPYREVFVRHAFAAEFLTNFQEVITALEESMDVRALHLTGKVGATKGLAQELRRGRAALEILDAAVKQHFSHDDELLGEWRAAKRVHLVAVRPRLVVELPVVPRIVAA